MKKYLLLILTIIFLNCTKIDFKEKFIVPDKNYILDSTFLKTKGYYYNKKTKRNHCKYEYKNGRKPIEESCFEEKYIKTIILYNNGSIYYPRNTVFNGFTNKITNQLDYCDLLSHNNYQSALINLEKYLNETDFSNHKIYQKGILQKGIFNIKANELKLQSYQGWPTSQYTIEEKATRLNDTTFVINSSVVYDDNSTRIINDTFHFKRFDRIPKSINYILKNRKEFGK